MNINVSNTHILYTNYGVQSSSSVICFQINKGQLTQYHSTYKLRLSEGRELTGLLLSFISVDYDFRQSFDGVFCV